MNFKRFIDREVLVRTKDREYRGLLTEVGNTSINVGTVITEEGLNSWGKIEKIMVGDIQEFFVRIE